MCEQYIIHVDYNSRDNHLPRNYGPFDSQKEAEEVAVRYAAALADAKHTWGEMSVRDDSPLVDGHCVDIYAGVMNLMSVQKLHDETPDVSRGY